MHLHTISEFCSRKPCLCLGTDPSGLSALGSSSCPHIPASAARHPSCPPPSASLQPGTMQDPVVSKTLAHSTSSWPKATSYCAGSRSSPSPSLESASVDIFLGCFYWDSQMNESYLSQYLLNCMENQCERATPSPKLPLCGKNHTRISGFSLGEGSELSLLLLQRQINFHWHKLTQSQPRSLSYIFYSLVLGEWEHRSKVLETDVVNKGRRKTTQFPYYL